MTSKAMEDLIGAWRGVPPEGPYVLPADQRALAEYQRLTVRHNSFAAYCADPCFGLDDGRLHIGLIPQPYVGNLREADVFLLMANPGLGPLDYFAEEYSSEYRNTQFQDLHQRDVSGFSSLNPKESWHGGGQYWQGRFRDLALGLCESTDCSFKDAFEVLARRVACLQLVPYHSTRFGIPMKLRESLKSVQLMKGFVHQDLRPRASNGEILIIVLRRVDEWGLGSEESESILTYPRNLRRGAFISRKSPGYQKILAFLRASRPA